MRLLLRFNSLSSLIRHLEEELARLRVTREQLEYLINSTDSVDYVDISGRITVGRMSRDDLVKYLESIRVSIEELELMLSELRDLMRGTGDYRGLILLEYDNVPRRVIITQPLTIEV